MEGWRGNFGNEIIKQWIVHERDIFLGNSGHILGYTNLGYEKAITPKWADQNTVFPEINVGLGHVNPAIVASKMVMAKETLCKDYLSSPVMHKITKTIHTVPLFPFWQNL